MMDITIMDLTAGLTGLVLWGALVSVGILVIVKSWTCIINLYREMNK